MTTFMGGRSVLVVDDDEVMRNALATRLRVEGYAVTSASNGREALDRLREMMPCLILLDYAMPVMNGVAFREAQKADARWSAIPVVVITGNHPSASEVRSMAPLAVLQKPITYEMLAPLLAEACGRERQAAQMPRISLTSRRRRA
jgi:CheY-like chemotaxis protein